MMPEHEAIVPPRAMIHYLLAPRRAFSSRLPSSKGIPDAVPAFSRYHADHATAHFRFRDMLDMLRFEMNKRKAVNERASFSPLASRAWSPACH